MRFTVLREKESLHALAQRVYKEGQAGGLARAEKALREYNPGLATGTAAAGAIVIVPEVSGTTATAESRNIPDSAESLLESLAEVIDSLQAVLDAATARSEEEAQGTLERATDRKFLEVLDQPEPRKLVKEAAEAARTRIERAKVLRAAHEKIVGQIREDIDALMKTVRDFRAPGH